MVCHKIQSLLLCFLTKYMLIIKDNHTKYKNTTMCDTEPKSRKCQGVFGISRILDFRIHKKTNKSQLEIWDKQDNAAKY